MERRVPTYATPQHTEIASKPDHEGIKGRRDQLTRASVRMSWGNARFEADADITPAALLAIGGMVGLMLLAVAPVILASAEIKNRAKK